MIQKMDVKQLIWEKQIQTVMKNLRKNRMEAYYVPSRDAVASQVAALLHPGDTVAVGGSETLKQTGVLELLRNGEYRFLDRYAPGLSPEQVRRIFLDSFDADAYLCSTNAVTLNGELYNVDGNANRVAAMCYGPRSVILVVGCNKIVKNLQEAVSYVKRVSAPANTVRLGCHTPCAETGICIGLEGTDCTAGCGNDNRICCTYVVMARQRDPGRIKVILVGEELGF